MTRRLPLTLAIAFVALASGCTHRPARAPATAVLAATGADSAAQRLAALLTASDEAFLRRNPIAALFRGDMRFAAHFSDYLSDAYW